MPFFPSYHASPSGRITVGQSLFRVGTLLFLLAGLPVPAWSDPVTGGEYFIGPDPGQGQGTVINPLPGVDEVVTFTVPATALAALPPGMHAFSLRWKDADNEWSAPATTWFYKVEPDEEDAALLAGLEYYFDLDPGEGQGVRISVPEDVGRADARTLTLPPAETAALAEGLHSFSLRYLNHHGTWSPPATTLFLKVTEPEEPASLAALHWEWWKRSDPSEIQAGAPIPLSSPSAAEELMVRLPEDNLTAGEIVSLRIWWVDANGEAGFPAVFSLVVPTHHEAWAGLHFTAEERADPAIAGPEADPDGDGASNLVELAMGSDPRHAASDGSPVIQRAEERPGEIEIGFQRLAGGTVDEAGVYRKGSYSYEMEELLFENGLPVWRPVAPRLRVEARGEPGADGVEPASAYLPVQPDRSFRLCRIKVTHGGG